jgi:hypothetical protein
VAVQVQLAQMEHLVAAEMVGMVLQVQFQAHQPPMQVAVVAVIIQLVVLKPLVAQVVAVQAVQHFCQTEITEQPI